MSWPVASIAGDFDPVGVGRAIIAEPDWAKTVQAGELHRLKPFSPSVIAKALQNAD
jgi:2,4-dienoyl-CoA reductase-like NADH-dependent reductase (Old Yellow Enzyme family)